MARRHARPFRWARPTRSASTSRRGASLEHHDMLEPVARSCGWSRRLLDRQGLALVEAQLQALVRGTKAEPLIKADRIGARLVAGELHQAALPLARSRDGPL